jgi:peptidoglycan/LPS O-acetylase OafA/YrhL
MSDDLSLAALLGEAPKTPDPGFRFNVLARVSQRAARREAWTRGLMQVAAFTAMGLLLALVQYASVSAGAWIPVLSVAGALSASAVFALVVIQGPKAALARARTVFGGA